MTEPQFVLVYPKVVPLRGYDLASRRPIGEIRLTHRLFEDPTRIAGVRGYQPGDPLNRVHWRATARTGVLHSKIYEPRRSPGATILLDFHHVSYPAQRAGPFGAGRDHRGLAGQRRLSLGQPIGLVTNGRDAADRIRQRVIGTSSARGRCARHGQDARTSDRLRPVIVETRRGPEQLLRILEALARLELTEGLSFAQLVIEAASRLPRDATVVAILPTAEPETAIALGNLKRRGYAVTAILVT